MQWVLVSVSLLAVCRANNFAADFKPHIDRVVEFACGKPQLRGVNVTDLLSPYQTYGKTYYPGLTVLHLCDASCGYCPLPGEYCGPRNFTYKQLPFSVTHMQYNEIYEKSSTSQEYIEVVEHTACECKARANVQKPPIHRPTEVPITKVVGTHMETVLTDRIGGSTSDKDNTALVSSNKGAVSKGSSNDVAPVTIATTNSPLDSLPTSSSSA